MCLPAVSGALHKMFTIVHVVRLQRLGVHLEQIDYRRTKETNVALAERDIAGKFPVEQDLKFDVCLAGGHGRGVKATQVDELELLGKGKVFEHGLLAIQFVVPFCIVGRPQPGSRPKPGGFDRHGRLRCTRASWMPGMRTPIEVHLTRERRIQR